jgi:hypothetical protein
MSRCKSEWILQIILISYPAETGTLGIVHGIFPPFMNLAVYKPNLPISSPML